MRFFPLVCKFLKFICKTENLRTTKKMRTTFIALIRVEDGTRTHDIQNHNLTL